MTSCMGVWGSVRGTSGLHLAQYTVVWAEADWFSRISRYPWSDLDIGWFGGRACTFLWEVYCVTFAWEPVLRRQNSGWCWDGQAHLVVVRMPQYSEVEGSL